MAICIRYSQPPISWAKCDAMKCMYMIRVYEYLCIIISAINITDLKKNVLLVLFLCLLSSTISNIFSSFHQTPLLLTSLASHTIYSFQHMLFSFILESTFSVN